MIEIIFNYLTQTNSTPNKKLLSGHLVELAHIKMNKS